PPCVPYWVGNNHGATYHGVTREAIRIMAPCGTAQASTGLADFIKFFNARFELYDRQITPDCETLALASDAPTNRAQAETAWANNDFGSMWTNAAEGGIYFY